MRRHSILIARRTLIILGLAVSLAAGAAGQAAAQQMEFRGWGVRGGFSSSPDQFVLGMHADMGELAENLRLQPAADIGFGDHLTVFTIGPDLTYGIPLEQAGTIYFGGTIGLLYWKADWDDYVGPFGQVVEVDDSSFEVGVAAIAGYEFMLGEMPLHVDLKIGITDEYPDFKAMLGYTFLRE